MSDNPASEKWEITSIHVKALDGTFVAKATGWNASGEKIAELEAEAYSLTRIVEMLAPAKPINI